MEYCIQLLSNKEIIREYRCPESDLLKQKTKLATLKQSGQLPNVTKAIFFEVTLKEEISF